MLPFPLPNFPPEAIADAKSAAIAAYPNESCGLIVNNIYVPCENTAADPTKDFKIDDAAVVKAGKDLQCVLHSHPDGVGVPSGHDMQSQIDNACIFGIIVVKKHISEDVASAYDPVFWGDYRLDDPLIGRQFIHGVLDCGSLIRSYFWQTQKIIIPDFARDYSWWKEGDDIYIEKFAKAGFQKIEKSQAQDGDIFLGKVNSPVPNHGGVILSLGRGLAIHHLDKRLSRREPFLPWMKFITHWLRYTGTPK